MLALALLILLAVPSPALAAPAWTPTQQLSAGFVESVPSASAPLAGVDATGAALVVWSIRRAEGARETDVWAAAAPAGGSFGPARVVLAGAADPNLVVFGDGRALLGATLGERPVLLAGRVDGTFGPAQVLGGKRDRITGLYQARGSALALIGRFERRTLVRDVSPDGAAGPARDVGLGGYAAPGILYVGGAPGDVARGADGTLVFPLGRAVLVRRPDGAWRRYATRLGARSTGAQAAVSPDGRISVAAITRPLWGEASAYGGISVSELRPGETQFGHVRPMPVRRVRELYTRDRPRPFAFGPAVAYDAGGQRVVAWIEDSVPDPGWETEEAVGRGVAWLGGRRLSLDPRAARILLTGVGSSVLALGDLGAWRSSLVGTVGLAGPVGSAYPGPAIAVSPARTLLAWRGLSDGAFRGSFLMP